MAAASLAACGVLSHVSLWVGVLSLILNFSWRGHDFACVVIVMVVAVGWGVRHGVWDGMWELLHDIGRRRAGV